MADDARTPDDPSPRLTTSTAAAVVVAAFGESIDFPRAVWELDQPIRSYVDYDFRTCAILSDRMVKALDACVPGWIEQQGGMRASSDAHLFLGRIANAMNLDYALVNPAALTNSVIAALNELASLRQPPPPAGQETVRVLRVIEYVGPRALVEQQVKMSVHGTRGGITRLPGMDMRHAADNARVEITAVTLNEYPDVLERARTPLSPEILTYPRLQEQAVEALQNLRGAVGDNLPEMDAAIEAVCRTVGVDPVEVYAPPPAPPPVSTPVHAKPPEPAPAETWTCSCGKVYLAWETCNEPGCPDQGMGKPQKPPTDDLWSLP